MSEAFIHLSVLGEEAPEALVGDPDGLYVDGTFGRGGHSRRILEKLSPKGRLIAFDRDPQAGEVARSWTDPRFTIIHEPFSTMTESLAAIGVHQADGIFLDIGVSSLRSTTLRAASPSALTVRSTCAWTPRAA